MRDAGRRYRVGGLLHAQGPLARAVGDCREEKNRTGGTVATSARGRVVAGLVVWWTTARRYQSRLAPAVDAGAQSSRHSSSRVDAKLETTATRRAVSNHRNVARISHRAKSVNELWREHDRDDQSCHRAPAR